MLWSPNRSFDTDGNANAMIALPTLRTEYDVVIVGCGLSGLVTAYKIKQKAPSLSIRIIEATNRLGGQVGLNRLGVDMGARWISSDQQHVLRMCNDLNIQVAERMENRKTERRQWEIDRSVFAGLARWELDRFLRYVDVKAEEYYPGRYR